MKNFKSLVFAALFVTSQVQAVDLRKAGSESFEWMGNKAEQLKENLLNDTTTQLTTFGVAATGVVGYVYYHNQVSQKCLDGHPNGRIIQKSNLMYINYADFLDMIESIDSYAATLEFINQYCIDYYFFTSHSKINRFVALADDLQAKNNKRADDVVFNENMILENFKNNLILAQANIEKEVLNDAINANKNANNMYSISKALEIVGRLLSIFSNNR
jgi:hypothetical protein